MNKSIIFPATILFLSFMSCVKDSAKMIPAVTVSVNFCDTITFSKHIKPIINNNCATSGCHVMGGSGDGDFTGYSGLKAKVDNGKFKLRVFDSPNNPMPAAGMLPPDQLSLIKCWLDKGANND